MRRVLLDTHVVLWWLSDDPRLGLEARRLIASPDNHVFVSAASVWEMAIKSSIGKLSIPDNVERAVLDCGFVPLEITMEHAAVAGQLPPLHKDPFDRMLVAQAQTEGLELITLDRRLGGYGITTIFA